MLIHGKIESTSANGPGTRAAIWFQGCTLACRGCWNPGTHSFTGDDVPLSDLASWLDGLTGVEGVTFSGGDPLQHYPALMSLVQHLRLNLPSLSIGIFTGYTVKELDRGTFQFFADGGFHKGTGEQWQALKDQLDFAVCGRFNQAQKGTDAMRGSTNQTIELFSDRYTVADFGPQIIEITISEDGELVQLTGFPNSEYLVKG